MKAIQKELGEDDEAGRASRSCATKLDALDLPEEARKEVDRELARLDAHRPRVDGVAGHPHVPRDDRRAAVERAQRGAARPARGRATILDEDHYGLGDVKDRVLEFLAVRQLRAAGRARGRDSGERRRGDDAGGDDRRRGRPPTAERRPTPSKDDEAAPRGRSCSSSARRASARRRSPSRSRARWGASTSASRSAARATRPTSAATGAPTSARMPGRIIQGMKQAGHQEPGLPARRGRQARRLVPGRSGERAARGARPGAERLVHRSLPRRAVRPVARCCSSRRRTSSRTSRARCSTAWRSSTSPATPSGEARDRAGATSSRASSRRTGSPRSSSTLTDDAVARGHRELHARSRACASSSASSAGWRARWRAGSPRGEVEQRRRSIEDDGRRPARPAARCTRRRWRGEDEVGVATGHVLHAGRRRHHVRRGVARCAARAS